MFYRLSRCLSLCCLFYALDGFCAEYGFRILHAALVPAVNEYVLNADVDYRFSEPAIEALEHGVPLTLVVRLRIKRHRDYWLDETVLRESRRFRIRYHPLAKSYQISNENNRATHHFASLSALLDALGEIRRWPVLPLDRLTKGQEYWASLAVDLDLESLPLPLRPVAYVSPSWYLGSPWFRWRVAE